MYSDSELYPMFRVAATENTYADYGKTKNPCSEVEGEEANKLQGVKKKKTIPRSGFWDPVPV